MAYRVELSERARRDLDLIIAQLARTSLPSADRLSNRFEMALGRLESFPLACGISFEAKYAGEDLRHLLFGIHPKRKYRALFVVRGDEVVILAIRAPGERPIGPEDVYE